MEDDHRYHDKSSTTKVACYSSLEGAATVGERLNVECQRELSFEFKM